MGATASTALANAFGVTLVKAGVAKIGSLLNLGRTGAEATAVVTESTATASLAADFAAGTERATAALATAERNAQVASRWAGATDAAAAERAAQAVAQAEHTAQVANEFRAGTQAARDFIATPSGQATVAQGSMNYPGVDVWVDGVTRAGQVVGVGEPGISGFAATSETLAQVGNDTTVLNQGLQIAPFMGTYRPGLTLMEVTQDVPSAFSLALANPQFGSGGLAQVFIQNIEEVAIPWVTRIMK